MAYYAAVDVGRAEIFLRDAEKTSLAQLCFVLDFAQGLTWCRCGLSVIQLSFQIAIWYFYAYAAEDDDEDNGHV